VTDDPAKLSTSGTNVCMSYASQDAAVANSIVEHLEGQGIRCWIAPRDAQADYSASN